MEKFYIMKRSKRGFTLAELLIVVAIIAVLVAIAIPIFNSQLEKARQAVDMHTARNIESALVAAINDGTIQIPDAVNNDVTGVWVTVCRDANSWPKDYPALSSNIFCGAEANIVINEEKTDSNWTTYRQGIANILKQAGMDPDSLQIKSKDRSKGWDWIIIEAGYQNRKIFTRIYSGFKGEASSVSQRPAGSTNIEKLIG